MHAIELVHADVGTEGADRLGRISLAAEAADRGHARVVPAADDPFLHELQQLALAQHRVGEVQARELDLPRAARHRARPRRRRHLELCQHPVVQLAVVLELERADRMRDALDPVLERMCPVVHRIVMALVEDAVHHRIAQVEVGRRHVDLGAEHLRAVGKLAGLHSEEELEVFLDRSVAIGALLAAGGEVAAR